VKREAAAARLAPPFSSLPTVCDRPRAARQLAHDRGQLVEFVGVDLGQAVQDWGGGGDGGVGARPPARATRGGDAASRSRRRHGRMRFMERPARAARRQAPAAATRTPPPLPPLSIHAPITLPNPVSATTSPSPSDPSSDGTPKSSPSGSMTSSREKSPKGKPLGCPSNSRASSGVRSVAPTMVVEGGGPRGAGEEWERGAGAGDTVHRLPPLFPLPPMLARRPAVAAAAATCRAPPWRGRGRAVAPPCGAGRPGGVAPGSR